VNVSSGQTPLVSIITVTKNCALTLPKTLESVRAVKTSLVEYIIIDGVSTDGTLDLIRAAGDLVDFYISEPDTGVYNAMNKGVDSANGQYLAFVNGDDEIISDGFLQALMLLQANHPDVLACRSRLVGSIDESVATLDPVPWHLYFFNSIPHPSSFVASPLLKALHLREDLRIASDYDLFLKLYLQGRNFQVSDAISAVHARGGLSSNHALSSAEVERIKRENLGPVRYAAVRTIECIHRLRKKWLRISIGGR
jgi:glycosyltransferase involved in cell wall biosynthesis